jgi:DNA-binding NtrC family response regulator
VLIVDDDVHFVRSLERLLRREGHDVAAALTAEEARGQLRSVEPDVVVLDYQLPGKNGLELLDELLPEGRGAAFLMVTAYPDVDVAVQAMRRGAFHYIKKGADLSEYLLEIERGARYAQARKLAAGRHRPDQGQHGLLGKSRAMKSLWERVRAVSQSGDTTVLLLGETGTGKSVIAQAIHQLSPRAYEPFVALDCTSVPSSLFESELFGYEKGSFTGATGTKKGRVEAAQEGTLFLDEIGEIELHTQTKLLRLLEEREYTRVGSTRARNLKARVITATNRDLEAAVAEGRFRADLRFRLEVFVVVVPPLRERDEDVVLLATSFVAEHVRVLGKGPLSIAPEVVEALGAYPFPGNVRELRNMVEQAVLLCRREELTLEDFPVLDKQRGAGGLRGGGHGLPDRRTELVPRLREASATPPDGPGRREERTQPDARAEGAARRGPQGAAAFPREGSPYERDAEGVGEGVAEASPGPRLWPRAPRSDDGGGTVLEPALGRRQGEPGSTKDRMEVPGGVRNEAGAGAGGGDRTQTVVVGRRAARARFEAEEKLRISDALLQSGGNVTAAARGLGLSRYQLLRRMKKYELD